MRNALKTVFFASAFSPTLITLSIINISKDGELEKIGYCLAITIFSIITCYLTIKKIESSSEKYKITIKKLKSYDDEIFKFFASYSLPIILKTAGIDFELIVKVIIILLIVLWFTHKINAHPILRIFGYRFYEAQTGEGKVFVLITKRQIRDPESIVSVSRITEEILVEDNNAPT